MKRSLWVLLVGLLSSLQLWGQTFSKAAYEQLIEQNKDKQWMVLLWSVDCPPCFKELAVISKLAQSNPKLPVVVINTDDDSEVYRQRDQIIRQFKLESLPILNFSAGNGYRDRFAIDKNWYGELPRSYFFATDGSVVGRSGVVNEAVLKQWLMPTARTSVSQNRKKL